MLVITNYTYRTYLLNVQVKEVIISFYMLMEQGKATLLVCIYLFHFSLP